MGIEVDLLENYPKPHRDTSKRANEKNDEIRKIARKFDFEFFDSDRKSLNIFVSPKRTK